MNVPTDKVLAEAPAIDVGAEAASGGLEWLLVGAIFVLALIFLLRRFVQRKGGCVSAKSCAECNAGCIASGVGAYDTLRGIAPGPAASEARGKDRPERNV
ncbi:hypothetical protein [Afifella pfennigii]|uniref:hypothetical protein n=1 Tax=Afifella pfennigii TaxID=209897 RepID=UPI0004787FB8|nr:hypothetical protein [Afifella pfennigii]